ncbi:SpoIIE family protein phosphatase [Kineococcus sp. SYSU DK006]|uniref:PP2C family protein-serine/threonine phosphatase n=1 Tax=Kineococcus sp. SYSU DK006 TaxID=3383127 RepID=UPI003D7D56A0
MSDQDDGAGGSPDAAPTGVSAVVPDALPTVVHDYPAAVLLIDTASSQVVFVNDLARQLAPGLALPVDVEEWSRAAGLQVTSGGALGTSSTPLARVAAGEPGSGRQVSAALRSGATAAREALWAIGMPLRDAPPPLRARSLLVLMPLRFPEAVADVQTAAAAGRAHGSVLASGLAIAISDPTTTGPVIKHPDGEESDGEDDPLIWVSPSFEQLTGYVSREALGRNCRFLQGPDTDPAALVHLRAGMAAQRTVSTTVLNYRHDGTAFYNHLVISPVFDADGELTHRVGVLTDVTQQVLAAREREAARAEAERARREEEQARHQAARAHHQAEQSEQARRFGGLLLTLSEALTATTTVADVAATITEVVCTELGAAGGGLLLADHARTRLDFLSMARMPATTEAAWSRIDWHEDAPLALAARTRRAVFYPDSAALLAAHPAITRHAQVPVMGASANLPLLAAGPDSRDVLGAVFLYWERPHELPAEQQAALAALARYTGQAVQRATLLAERRSAAEVLQRSLLPHLPEPDHLELRARYVPAATGEHVGGDWYDAVVLPDGATALVIGDVTGHDMTAAARMGQLRGLLRAYAFDREEPPSEVVARLDRATVGLHMDTLATLVLARIEQDQQDTSSGMRRLRWTNAGHPAPILLLADGTTQVLRSAPELLLGLLPDTARTDHTHPLPPGSTLLLYTDGLIEHRGRNIDDGIADLRRVLSTCAHCTLEELLEHVQTELVGQAPEDDCAILAVRLHPEDRPRPDEAGPTRMR